MNLESGASKTSYFRHSKAGVETFEHGVDQNNIYYLNLSPGQGSNGAAVKVGLDDRNTQNTEILQLQAPIKRYIDNTGNRVFETTAVGYFSAQPNGELTSHFVDLASLGVKNYGYVTYEVTASGYASSGQMSLNFKSLIAGYGGHTAGAGFHKEENYVNYCFNCAVELFNPEPTQYGLTVITGGGTSNSIQVRARWFAWHWFLSRASCVSECTLLAVLILIRLCTK